VEAARHTIGLALALVSSASCKFDELPRLPDPDALKPCEMAVTDLSLKVIYEGTGTGGSRPVVLVISGQNLVNGNIRVSLKEAAGSETPSSISIDNEKLEVGEKGTHLAVPITLAVDPTLSANARVPLDVRIEQDCAADRVSAEITGQLALRGLDELAIGGSTISLPGGVQEFSLINVETGVIQTMANQIMPIVLRSRSSVRITSGIKLDASGRIGGPAGGTGGAGGSGLGGVATPGTGPHAGQPSGGPGGFTTTDPGLNTLNLPNRSSGGAGGNGTTLGTGGNGGGGGGSIEISAGGDVTVGAISARGAAGTAGSGGAGAGGGGSGGVILLRAGGSLTAGDIDVSGGGGTGAAGRARYDAGGVATVSTGSLGTDHLRGPMFTNLPLAVHASRPTLTILGKPSTSFQHFVVTPDGATSTLTKASLGQDGTAKLTPVVDLLPGANQLCLVTESGTLASETRNCVDLAYLP
jgi:hypothetical protein